jgi:SAM-dependent methyltransferase
LNKHFQSKQVNDHELTAVVQRYARRKALAAADRYNPLNASIYMTQQEKERALIRWIGSHGLAPLSDKKVLEVGCGTGSNLLQLIRLGFRPANLVGNELLADRVIEAREQLPAAIKIIEGDAASLDFPIDSFDVVLQSTVFSSILDDDFQFRLAGRMWTLVKPGGGILWYDFSYDNPINPDVRGVPLVRIRRLFPEGTVFARRTTLAPPISRFLTRWHPQLYTAANLLPFLRTHLLCWIKKNA